ncbi:MULTISPECIES: hypothetical protein [unclassified Empedobacter]|uniref:hypothetical protein n=1 Tax=unclassified Empedobacter TaxID=2643773 RepID=UPI0025C64418|nr:MULTISPECIES: hypothetical protein [unclassified Empedobacter]
MNKNLLFLITLSISSVAFCQDLLKKVDGEQIDVKVLEISKTEIKYKKNNVVDSPIYKIDTNDVNNITFSNGEIEFFNKSIQDKQEEYLDKENNNIDLIFKQNNNVYIERVDEANLDAENYLVDALNNWGYWNIINNKEEADFIIEFSLRKRIMGDRTTKVILKTLSGKVYKESKNYTASPTAFSGYNGSRASVQKLVNGFFVKTFK